MCDAGRGKRLSGEVCACVRVSGEGERRVSCARPSTGLTGGRVTQLTRRPGDAPSSPGGVIVRHPSPVPEPVLLEGPSTVHLYKNYIYSLLKKYVLKGK